ncbi:MAG: flavin reductase family protein [Thauera sp.]|nr:flavin reductase family protein [Thauera sp.]
MSQTPISHEAFTRQFRDALGMFATGITVVATRAPDGQPIGLTVNSFNSVSLDPPLIVWSLSSNLPCVPIFESCEYYSVNVLAADQDNISNVFASRSDDKFAGIETDTGMYGVPLLKGCCARFECRNTVRHDGGDHIVFISEVVRFDHDESHPPLIYWGGAYQRLAP